MTGRPQRRIRGLIGTSAVAAGLAGVGVLAAASPAAAASLVENQTSVGHC